MGCDLFLFAGEKSGDLHGEKLIQALRAKNPDLRIVGVGGPRMRAQGLKCLVPMEEFQVMGFVDVFFALPKLLRQFYFISKQIRKLQPKAVVTIDYPGFNLRLARHLKKRGFQGKCIHYICPSVWAWGKKRIPFMAKYLDLLLSILPFEKELFQATSLPVTYVGHPLVQRLKEYSYQEIDALRGKKIIALFPGSRKKEIERNLPLYLDACRTLQKKHSEMQVALSLSAENYRELVLSVLHTKGWSEKEVLFVPGEKGYELMKAAHLAIAKSGTVTLELAMHRVPTVVTYAVSCLDKIIAYDILRIRLPFYSLPNIIAQKEVFVELIGPRLTRKALEEQAEKLCDKETRQQIEEDCDALLGELGHKNASQEAAQAILDAVK